MFTGLVRESGWLIEDPTPSAAGGVRLKIAHSRELGEELEVGASLAVSGVCLTVVETTAEASEVELSPETLAKTTLGALHRASPVNLEPALRLGEALGGHWVQGHVDATTEVVLRRDLPSATAADGHRELGFALDSGFRGLVVEKGSLTIDGVSLTISALSADRFEVALIPQTLEVTTLRRLEPGDRVNLEVDILAKYVHRALATAGVVPA